MCGIIGLVSKTDIFDDALAGLASLEYRGYDSYGISYRAAREIKTIKDIGAASEQIDLIRARAIRSNEVICHTRWATHGGVSKVNAHPHLSYDSRISIVHNGVIENHIEIRHELRSIGVECISDTDSEVIAHLVAYHRSRGFSTLESLLKTTEMISGEYAICLMDLETDGKLYCVAHKSPLIFGISEKFGFVTSDLVSIESECQYNYIEPRQIAIVSCDDVKIVRASQDFEPVAFSFKTRKRDSQQISKGKFDHFMLKEIHEIPAALKVGLGINEAQFDQPNTRSKKIYLSGAGSAYYVALLAQYFFSQISLETTSAYPADEAVNLIRMEPNDYLIAITQSGETFDTIEVVRLAQEQHGNTIVITNSMDSTISRLSNDVIFQNVGKEICVLSTKSVLSQVLIMLKIAIRRGLMRKKLSVSNFSTLNGEIRRLPEEMSRLIESISQLTASIAKEICHVQHWFFIGKGSLYPVALESALKFKEVSYLHAEGLSAGFLKHGTISLIENGFYSVVFIPSGGHENSNFGATISACNEIAARGGNLIGIGPRLVSSEMRNMFDYYIEFENPLGVLYDPFFHLVVGQLFAYNCGRALERNIDRPRGLAKSVTVR